MTELVWSIKNGDLNEVKDKIENEKVDVKQEINGRTLVHYAADYGQNEVLSYLISKGCDVNAKDKHGISCLLAAIWEGHAECCRILLNAGAEKTGTAPNGATYLESAEKDEVKALLT